MSTGLLETCREVKYINTLKKSASRWLLTSINYSAIVYLCVFSAITILPVFY